MVVRVGAILLAGGAIGRVHLSHPLPRADCGKGAMGKTGFGFSSTDGAGKSKSCWGWITSGSVPTMLTLNAGSFGLLRKNSPGKDKGVVFESCCLVAEGVLSDQGASRFGNWDPECCTSLQLWYQSPSIGDKPVIMTRKSVTSSTNVVSFSCTPGSLPPSFFDVEHRRGSCQ